MDDVKTIAPVFKEKEGNTRVILGGSQIYLWYVLVRPVRVRQQERVPTDENGTYCTPVLLRSFDLPSTFEALHPRYRQ